MLTAYPHALVGRLNGETDFSAGYATFIRLARTQLLTIPQKELEKWAPALTTTIIKGNTRKRDLA
ncbi:MAG: hypothetical protein ACKON9_11205, partial [Planctomycetaceae bacterium]